MSGVDFEALMENLWKNRRQDASVWEPMAEILLDHCAHAPESPQGFCALASALLHQAKGDFENALREVELAHEAFNRSNQRLWQCRSFMMEGFLLVNHNLFIEALSSWKSAYELGQQIHDRETIINSLYSIAILNRVNLQRYEDAIDYFTRVLNLCLETDPPYAIIGNVYSGLSKCHLALGHKHSAEHFAQLALEYAKLFGDSRTLGWSLELCVTTYIALEDLEKAHAFALENLEVWLRLDDAYGLAIAYQDLARVHRLEGRLTDALRFGQSALDYALTMQSQMVQETLYQELATLAEALGDFEKSLEYYKAYMVIREKSLKAAFDQEISKVSGELKLENYRLRHVELQEKIRALKTTQEALVRSEKMNALLGLVGGVAHEINTPLGNSMTLNSFILNQCEVILNKVNSEMLRKQELLDYLETELEAQKGIEKGLSTVSRIVESFKRIAVNPSVIHKQEVNTLEFLESWQQGLKIYHPEYPARIEVHCPDHHHCHIDVVETLKILDELFLNAMKHGYKRSGSPLATDENPPLIQIAILKTNSKTEGQLHFTFKDFGCGIESQWLKRIFEPFIRDGSGLGIGLHVVYNIVVYVLEGTIHIKSTVGEGTTVRIRM